MKRRAALLVLILLLAPHMARAEATAAFDPQLLEPADNADGLTVTKSAEMGRSFQPTFGFHLQYLRDPLVRVGANGEVIQRVIRNQFRADVTAALWILPFWEIGAMFGGVPYQDGTYFGTRLPIQKTGWADTRVFSKFALIPRNPTGLALALYPMITLPTGDRRNYLGEAWPTFVPQVLASWRYWGMFVGANLGFRFRRPTQLGDFSVSQEFLYRFGAGWRLGWKAFTVEPYAELYGAVGFDSIDPRRWLHTRNKPLEADTGVRLHFFEMWTVGAAAGVGLIGGYGSPDVRVLGTVQFTLPQLGTGALTQTAGGDLDGDGLADNRDQCPRDAEDFDDHRDGDGCPEADNDTDGIADADDACRDLAGIPSRRGCPVPDADADGLEDTADRCPAEPGPETLRGCALEDRDGDGVPDQADDCGGNPGPASNRGCPLDTDGDLVIDARDRCPSVPGPATNDGCPPPKEKTVVLSKERIEILHRIDFKQASAELTEDSLPTLDEVAYVLKENPQITKVRVEGHTSSEGGVGENDRLSAERAEAVVRYLVEERGIASSRLEPAGYGMQFPLVPNTTEANRARNRRVEFTILDDGDARRRPPPPPPPPASGGKR